ncbi:MAG: hypothetical protein FD161_1507 [Limisphaerales bacterium]|nr:MAG: hypothetical protein FD161_1507 [Limisphaerales bacterium]KAG0509321.1 MAG: hypothetical protein E1N63_1426 [Limisphaerales bacterium]TXT52066.1 MAG: hypothetical protein FD140_999 [Limisphaerales bacterium]
MSRPRLSPLLTCLVVDFSLSAWSLAVAYSLDGYIGVLEGLAGAACWLGSQPRAKVWSRWFKWQANRLQPGERRVRYRLFCGQAFCWLGVLAYMLPFPFWSAATWCIMGVVLVVVLPGLDEVREQFKVEEALPPGGIACAGGRN